MRCETCGDGDRPGWIRKTFCDQSYDWIICPACNGTGIASCCDGAVGGPDEVTNGDTKMDDIKSATDQLCELTKRWTTYEDVPRSQQYECREIGRKLHELGGEAAMRDAYYEATGRNRAARVLAAYFDGIGDWRW